MPPIKTDVIVEAIAKGTEKTIQQLEQVAKSIEKVANKKYTNTGFKALTEQINALGASVEKLAAKQPRGLTKLATDLDKTRATIQSLGTAVEGLGKKFDEAGNKGGMFGNKLTMNWNLKDMIKDVEQMIMVQLRWYAAQTLIFGTARAIGTGISESVKFSLTTDYARGMLGRYGAMEGKGRSEYRKEAQEVVDLAKTLQQQLGLSFDEIVKSADRLLAAGTSIDTVKKSLESFVKLQVTFPDIEPEKFTTAVVGILNTFRNTEGLGQFATDAEKINAILDKTTATLARFVLAPRDMGPLLQNMGQLAQLSGFSFDQMLALAGMVTNLGAKAGNAGRLMAGLFASLGTEKTQEELKQIGIVIDRDKSIAEQFTNIIKGLRDAIGTGKIGGLSIAGMEEIGKLTSVERQRMLGLLVRDFEDLGRHTDFIAGSLGSLNRAWGAMDETANQGLEKTKGLLLGLGEELFSLVLGVDSLKSAIEYLNAELERWLKFWKEIRSLKNPDPFQLMMEESALRGSLRGTLNPWAKSKTPQGATRTWEEPLLASSWYKHMTSTAGFGDSKSPPLADKTKYGQFRELAFRDVKLENRALEYELEVHLSNLEKQYKTGELGLYDYTETRLNTMKEYKEKEKKNLEDLEKELSDIRAKQIRQAAGDAAKITLINEQYESLEKDRLARLARVKVDITKLENEGEIMTYERSEKLRKFVLDGTKAQDEKEREVAVAQQKAIYEIAKDKQETVLEIEKSLIDERMQLMEDSYSRGAVDAKTYYDFLEAAARRNAEIQIALATTQYELWRDQQRALLEFMKSDEDRSAFLSEDATRQALLSGNIEKIRATLKGQLAGYGIQRRNEPGLRYKDTGGANTLKSYLQEAIKDYENWGLHIKSMSDTIATSMSESFGNFFFDVMTGELKGLQEYFLSFVKAIGQQIANTMAQIAAAKMIKGVMGAGSLLSGFFHAGGVVGSGGPMRLVPADTFIGAPRLHSGLAGDEFPAILQKGETVLKKGTTFGPSNVVVNIDNRTGTNVGAKDVKVKFDMESMVVGIILDNKRRNGPLRMS